MGSVAGQLVTFTTTFNVGRQIFTSESTLRFRSRDDIEVSINSAGLSLVEVRDAPDRPGLEFVFIAELGECTPGNLEQVSDLFAGPGAHGSTRGYVDSVRGRELAGE